MVFIAVPNTAELVLQQAMAGSLLNNVLNFAFPAVPDTVDLTDLAGAALAAWIAEMAPMLSASLDLNAAKATSLENASAPSIIVPATAGTDGDISGGVNPLNVALVLSQQTALRGRSYRGRYYQGGIPLSANNNAGNVQDAYCADLIAAFVAFILAIETATGATHVVASRYTNGAPRATGVATPITSYSANIDFDSQRNRLLGRGT
jgi:hypothetical protein